MSNFNSNPFANNPVDNGLNHTIGTASFCRGQAQLIVFPPRRIPNQVKRAHLYQFTGDFISDLSDNVEKAITGPYNHLSTFLPGSAAAKASIIPDANGIPIETSRLSDFWMFILIVDHAPTNSLGVLASMQKRNIYSGWCACEPATRSFNTVDNWAINFNCVLRFTHDTTMIMRNAATQGGMIQQLDVNRDVDYLPGQILGMISRAPSPASTNPFDTSAQALAGAPLYESTPQSIRNHTTIPENQHQFGSFGIGIKPIDSEENITISSSLNSPSKHLSRIVGSLVDTVKQTTEDSSLANNNGPFFHPDPYTAQSVFTSVISQNTGGLIGAIDATKPVLISELDQMFNLHVQVVEPNTTTPLFDVMQTQAPTRKNILTDILTNSMPTCLIENNLADIIFSYSSWVPNQNTMFGTITDPKGMFNIQNFSPLIPNQSQERIVRQMEQFKHYFEFIIAPLIKHTGGEFQVHIHASLAGTTLVQLNLLDDVPDYGLVETNNLLGGINSPMVGPMSAVQTNASQLYHAVDNICMVPFDAPPIDSGVYDVYGAPPQNPFATTHNSVQF